MRMPLRLAAAVTLFAAFAASPRSSLFALFAADPPAKSPFDALHFRDIGPAATGGRIHDIQIDPRDPAVLYVAAATGGIWKSTNKGISWKPIFEHQADNTFGALAIYPRDSNIIWAG